MSTAIQEPIPDVEPYPDRRAELARKFERAAPTDRRRAKRLAVFIPNLASGGVAQVILRLVNAFAARGYEVDLVLCRAEGAFSKQVPESVRVVELKSEPGWRSRLTALAADWGSFGVMLLPVLLPLKSAPPFPYLGDLVRYLRDTQPDVVFTAKTHTNLVALWARRLAGVNTRIVISERTHLSRDRDSFKIKKWRWRFVVPLIHRVYPRADAIVAVSEGVAEDLVKTAALPRASVTTIYNPVLTDDLFEKSKAPVDHAWFKPGGPPVILGVGRLVTQKDFPTLLRAFALVRAEREARLVILGEGKDSRLRAELLELAERLGITQDVALPGFVKNPFAYMAKANVFVLSSAWEGFANALAEAIACGCPVVSTDCPSGPAEVLDGGAYGTLVRVGDYVALAQAINETLDNPPDRQRLRDRGAEFSIDRSVDRHLELFLGQETQDR